MLRHNIDDNVSWSYFILLTFSFIDVSKKSAGQLETKVRERSLQQTESKLELRNAVPWVIELYEG